MSLLDLVLQYVVVPIGVFLGVVYQKQQLNITDIAVLKAQVESNKASHEREMIEIRNTTNKIFDKLDSMEQALRK